MKIKVTILVDNRAAEGLLAEHGLSLWIETGKERILFDTGMGGALASNADTLGVDLGLTDILVLSHGHFDHTGGVCRVLENSQNVAVYCNPAVMKNRYVIRDGKARQINIQPDSMKAVLNLPPQNINWISQTLLINENIGIVCPIPRATSYEDTGGAFYLDPQGLYEDLIDDDLALWIKTKKGLVVFVGCCHSGLINILNHISRLNKGQKILSVIGGFHLLHADKKRIDMTISALQSFLPIDLHPCHCTGDDAMKELKTAFEDHVKPGYAGAKYSF
ncbi:MAG: MBL fold metallo-hydrolase [Pseudomonadota bacterium]